MDEKTKELGLTKVPTSVPTDTGESVKRGYGTGENPVNHTSEETYVQNP